LPRKISLIDRAHVNPDNPTLRLEFEDNDEE
jgi:hypothetical protein